MRVVFVVTVGVGGGVSGSIECRDSSSEGTPMVSGMADFGEVTTQHGRVGDGAWIVICSAYSHWWAEL